jgi:hypothetical protein
MLAILDTIRDALMALALAWIGVVVEPAPPPQAEASARSGDTAGVCATTGQSGACTSARQPGFSTPDCTTAQK